MEQLTFDVLPPKRSGTSGWAVPFTDHLLVEDTPGGLVFLNTVHGCSCNVAGCAHSKIFHEVLTKAPYGTASILKSAMHKAIRRNDVPQALQFGRWAAHFHGNSWPKDYARRVLLEEARSTATAKNIKSLAGHQSSVVLAHVTALKKKSMLVGRQRETVFEVYVKAFNEVMDLPDFLSALEVQKAVAAASTFPDFMRIWWRCFRVEGAPRVWFIDAVAPLVRDKGGVGVTWLDTRCWATGAGLFYGGKVFCELLFDIWGSDADEFITDPTALPKSEDVPLFPAFPEYTHDCHTRAGKPLLINNWDRIGPEMPMPPGIDLRWSGMLYGVCWRELAARQFGNDFTNVPWESVKFPSGLWDLIDGPDRFFYADFYARLDRRFATGPTSPTF